MNRIAKALVGTVVVALTGCGPHARHGVRAEPSIHLPSSRHVTRVPDPYAQGPCGSSAFDLHACLAMIVEKKLTDEQETIEIAPGEFEFRGPGGLLIFQRKNIEIRGTPTNDGRPGTRIAIAPQVSTDAPVLKRYFAEVIDSSGITFSNFELDGAGLRFRGIGVCPLGDDPANPTAHISVRNLKVSGFTDFFMIVGNTNPHEYLHGSADEDRSLSRLYAFTGEPERADSPRQYCEGEVHDITVEDNDLRLNAVGFYLVPLLSRQTKTLVGIRAPFLLDAQDPAHSVEWSDAMRNAASRNSRFLLRRNRFVVDLSRYHRGSYESQITNYFHSMIKLSGATGVLLEDNLIDAGSNLDVFGNGGAVNIGSDVVGAVLRRNRIEYPPAQRFADRAVVVGLGFGLHVWYGVGALSFFELGGARTPTFTPLGRRELSANLAHETVALVGPSLGTTVVSNEFVDAAMTVTSCCSNTIDSGDGVLAWANVGDFCRDIDAHQSPSDRKADGLSVRDNSFVFSKPHAATLVSGLPSASQEDRIRQANAAFAQKNPTGPLVEWEYCRQNVSVSLNGNRVLQPH